MFACLPEKYFHSIGIKDRKNTDFPHAHLLSNFLQVLSLILPLRYDLVRFGGSWPQRQVFTVTVIEAAVRAKQVPLALALVAELKVIYSLGTLTASV